MALVQFPSNPSDGDIYTENNVTYTWNNTAGLWEANNATALADTFVEVAGDNMTGDLTLGTDKIALDATEGSGTFEYAVFAARFNSTSITAAYSGYDGNNGNLRTFQVGPDGTTQIGGNLGSTTDVNTPNIGLNPDGSAQFAGDVEIGTGTTGSPNIALKASGVVEAGGYRVFDVTTNTQVGKLVYSSGFSGLALTGEGRNVVVQSNSAGTLGVQLSPDATSWSVLSSESRLKDIVGDPDTTECWNLIRDIELKRYFYKEQDDEFRKGVSYMGPMADWLGVQDPELLIDTGTSDDEGPIHTFNQALLDSKALQALSTALTRIEELEARLDAAGI